MTDDNFTILLVEDDPNDVLLLERAFKKNNITNPIRVVTDGEQAISYLSGVGKYADRTLFPSPKIIVMDIKMPRKSGLEVLEWIKENPRYQVIPTLVMSSSSQEKDIQMAYELGANTYLVKPSTFEELQSMIKAVYDYWKLGQKPIPWSEEERPAKSGLPRVTVDKIS